MNIFSRMDQQTDAELALLSADGNKDAFGEVVRRYQSLICSITYSRTGDLASSEDLAQETFVTAWKQIRNLKEPGNLKSWICGIARNLVNSAHRKSGRTPTHKASSLDSLSDTPTEDDLPSAKAISEEEQALLWRSMEEVPEKYREPLILYYREGQSIDAVAAALDITEDNARQRLARGRKYLQATVTEFVETALIRSGPGRAFTGAVLASLPFFATSAKAASIAGGATKGSAVAKAATGTAWFGATLGPLVGLLGAWIGYKSALDNTHSDEERSFIKENAKKAVLLALVFNVALVAAVMILVKGDASLRPYGIALTVVIPICYVVALLTFIWRWNKRFRQIQANTLRDHPELEKSAAYRFQHREMKSRLTFLGVPLYHMSTGKKPDGKSVPAVGWFAFGDKAYGLIAAMGGVAIAPFSMGGVAIGGIAFGGAGLGILSFAGAAVGGLAVGGLAVGYLASGGVALGWLLAKGGVAIAQTYAHGGVVMGEFANTPEAIGLSNYFTWIDFSNPTIRNSVSVLAWLPMFIFGFFIWRKRKGKTV